MIAAPGSGSGKTTVALGLMGLLHRRGLRVQPFKCGPDYIDTKFHQRACQRPSINLDLFMAGAEGVEQAFARYAADADVSIVEGMMGLFDGYERSSGSCAEVARLLDLPIVLVVQARSAAWSMVPLLQGFKHYDARLRLVGVIFNQVGSERHAAMLRDVCSEAGMDCLGCIPRRPELAQGSRYLGLDFSEQTDADAIVELMEQHVDVDRLLTLHTPKIIQPQPHRPFIAGHTLVARNAESFSFLYQQTLDAMEHVSFFDPETEVPRLDGVDTLYLPGGYPEKHAATLTAQVQTRRAIRDFAERGGRIVAECGGMMYLCQSIVTDEGEFDMCGVLPYRVTARKADRKLSLGYRRFTLPPTEGLALPAGEYRGHEFHYSQFLDPQPQTFVQVFNAKGENVSTPVIRHKNVVASYTHLAAPLHLPPIGGVPSSDGLKSSPYRGEMEGGLSPLMFVGTGSDVGKSVLAAAFCRIFRQDGYHPAPFKAQNMALNSFATPDGLEIGRAQAVQAEAAGIPCHTDMNPLLLKPQSDHTSQVVLNGRPVGNRDAYDYFRRDGRDELRQQVCAAFDRLAARFNPIVMEGAGSISELNLRDSDIVNMPMARHADARVILVGDIDRGGVFASVYGSIALLPDDDRRRICGIIINKFRGDMRLFDEGRSLLEKICGIPVLGVIPYFKDIHIEEEDSVSLAQKSRVTAQGRINIAVVMLQHISNFTDFDALEQDPRIHLFYTAAPDDLRQADIVVLPGSKSTLDDLYHLRRSGMAQAIVEAHREGKTVVGICGGYQMLGVEVCDPLHVEGDAERLPGLGLLPVTTTLSGEKVTRQVSARWLPFDDMKNEELRMKNESNSYSSSGGETDILHSLFPSFSPGDGEALLTGYEIHMGVTKPFGDAPASPLFRLSDGREDGYYASPQCMGTYLHGIFDNRAFVDFLLQPYAAKRSDKVSTFDYQAFKQEQYDRLADHVRQHVDLQRIYQILRHD